VPGFGDRDHGSTGTVRQPPRDVAPPKQSRFLASRCNFLKVEQPSRLYG
jgi:hypothetical protein